ncbi:MAG: S49 family peptidase [Halobacteriaceae archaeon]
MGGSDTHGDGSIVDDVREDVGRGIDAVTDSYVLLVVIGLLLGLQLAPVALSAAPGAGTAPKVAVIRLSGGIDGDAANAVATQIERAVSNPAVEAIVLRVNSPGGGAAASEQLYLTVARAATELPVIVSVNSIAASGAYYTAVAADHIFVKPSSLIGSVGVVFIAPRDVPPREQVVVTGPAKETGGDRRSWYYKVDAAKHAFLGAVMAQRGDALSISRTEIATAKLFSAPRAVQTGIADEIGGLQAAIQHAAEAADLNRYRVTVYDRSGTTTFVTRTAYTASPVEDKRLVGPEYFVGNGTAATGPNILMLAQSVAYQAFSDRVVPAGTVTNASAATNRTRVSGGEVV